MDDTIHIHSNYQSQFGLLNAMAIELAQAFNSKNYNAKLINLATDPHPTSGTLLFFNSPPSTDLFPDALFQTSSKLKAIQYFVDHPFALPDSFLDEWASKRPLDNLHLALPCMDDTHILRPRFPSLVHTFIPHGLPRSALCNPNDTMPESIDNRPYDIVLSGSIWEQSRIDSTLQNLSQDIRSIVIQIAGLMIENPHLGFLAANDLVLGSKSAITGNWNTNKNLWMIVIAIVNRKRRVDLLRFMQGLNTAVFGSKAWLHECTGTIKYAGEVNYTQSAHAFNQGKIAIAWGPTQFVHSYSERIMHAAAAGTAIVADDRLLVHKDFQEAHPTLFHWSNPRNARNACDQLLANPDQIQHNAQHARAFAESQCLWEHRVDQLASIANIKPQQPAVISS